MVTAIEIAGRKIGPGHPCFVVAEAGGRICGAATLIIVPNLTHQGRPYAIVENVVVDETQRGAGFGELLMRHAIEAARRAGCYKLSLTSNRRRA